MRSHQDQGRIKWTRGPGQSRDRESPKRLAQLRRVSHALVSTLQKHRSKLIRFGTGSQHFRDSWVTTYSGSCVSNLLKQKAVSQKTIFLLLWHYTTIYLVIDSLTIFIAQILHSHMYWGNICLHSLADWNVHRSEKILSTKCHAKQLEPYHLTEDLRWKLYNSHASRQGCGFGGFWVESGSYFFVRLRLEVQLDHFLHHIAKLRIPVEMIPFLLKRLLIQIIIAVFHDFHWLLVATKLLTAKLYSLYVKESVVGNIWKVGVGVRHFTSDSPTLPRDKDLALFRGQADNSVLFDLRLIHSQPQISITGRKHWDYIFVGFQILLQFKIAQNFLVK